MKETKKKEKEEKKKKEKKVANAMDEIQPHDSISNVSPN